MIFIYLISGLFLGWSLGANDTANIFGTAVGSKMVKFKTAAIIASIFVILGAVISGTGAAHTLGKLGDVNAIGGAFTVALAAAISVTWMTKLKLPVSTSQAIVGAIIGWNFFSNFVTDVNSLKKIVSTWIFCPILTAIFAFILFKITQKCLNKAKIHLLSLDLYTRISLILVGAFGAYSLGANNIANVMGVFITSSPFKNINIGNLFVLTSTQQLFLIGAIAISLGIITYSKKVMMTVGNELFKLSPVTALIVVLSESLVLFIFSSSSIANFISSIGLPPLPLVPVSSSQAVVGGVIGIGVAKGVKGINFKLLGKIASGWVLTPIIAGGISFISLFFMQNVFQTQVYKPITYIISENLLIELKNKYNLDDSTISKLKQLQNKNYTNAIRLKSYIENKANIQSSMAVKIIKLAKADSIYIDSSYAKLVLTPSLFSENQIKAVKSLHGKLFLHKWELEKALMQISKEWQYKPALPQNIHYNKLLKEKYNYLFEKFKKSQY